MMTLYHFTDAKHWPLIRGDGAIRPTWSRGGDGQAETAKLAHFSESPRIDRLPWKLQDRTIRIAVSVDETSVTHWPVWLRAHVAVADGASGWSLGAPDDRATEFGPRNQWNGDPFLWYVSEMPVLAANWVRVDDLTKGEPLTW
jgi:hypothetical protein